MVQRKSAQSKTKRASRKPGPACPECGSNRSDKGMMLSWDRSTANPWSDVLQAVRCKQCRTWIPAHLWHLWGDRTPAQAKEEWHAVYRNHKLSGDSKRGSTGQKSVDHNPVEYVDEEGNPIDSEEIDPETTEFSDKFGRPTDQYGNLLQQECTEAEAVAIAVKILEAGVSNELVLHCERQTKSFPESHDLWQLLGVGYGALGDGVRARIAFLQALSIKPDHAMTLANYITSCFHAGDKTAACETISKFFGDLSIEGQRIVMNAIATALKKRLIGRKDLPQVILELLRGGTNS